MTMIRISDSCYVSADHITKVEVNSYRTYINVHTKDGSSYASDPNYGESIFAALDRLISQINLATAATKNHDN